MSQNFYFPWETDFRSHNFINTAMTQLMETIVTVHEILELAFI